MNCKILHLFIALIILNTISVAKSMEVMKFLTFKAEGSFIRPKPELIRIKPSAYLKNSDINTHLTIEHCVTISNILLHHVGIIEEMPLEFKFDLTRLTHINPLLYSTYCAGWKAKKESIKQKRQKTWAEKHPIYNGLVWGSLSVVTTLGIGWYTSLIKIPFLEGK